MPIVRIDIQEGKSTAYKRSILHGVRRAITFALGVGDERIMSRLIETPAENIDAGERRSDSFTIIEIAMLAGRGAELKFKLYETIIRELRFSPGIVASDVVVYVLDPPAECFCIGGDTSAAKLAAHRPHSEDRTETVAQPEGSSPDPSATMGGT